MRHFAWLLACSSIAIGGCSKDWDGQLGKHSRGASDAAMHDDAMTPMPTDDGSIGGDAEIDGSRGGEDAEVEGGVDGSVDRPDAEVPVCTDQPVSDDCVECDDTTPCRDGWTCVDNACTFVPPPRVPSGVFQSSGGGRGTSSSYRLRWSVGMPQPFGTGKSSSYHLSVGPGAGRP